MSSNETASEARGPHADDNDNDDDDDDEDDDDEDDDSTPVSAVELFSKLLLSLLPLPRVPRRRLVMDEAPINAR